MPFSSAANLSLDSPAEVDLEEEFSVSISADSSDVQDVKVFVHDSDDAKIDKSEYISEIYNDGWKDSYYYVKQAYPDTKDYKIRVLNSPGERQICVRLRKTGSSSFSTKCNPIVVIDSPDSNKDKKSDKNSNEDQEEDEEDMGPAKREIVYSVQPNITKPAENKTLSYEPDNKIVLNSGAKIKLSQKALTTPEGNKTNFLIYGFTGFCILIIVLLALRKL